MYHLPFPLNDHVILRYKKPPIEVPAMAGARNLSLPSLAFCVISDVVCDSDSD